MDREIRDPIHGFIKRSSDEEKLIDTRAMQRLRGIKQLALANLVYPGALHTRFDHSIGVMHITGRIIGQLKTKLDDKDKNDTLRLAALLHDVGHGPFSHVSEDVLDHYSKTKLSGKVLEKTHEAITCKIIEKDKEISKLISEIHREEIINLIKGERCDYIRKNIISGPLDADKQDYLLRDSYYCGVKYGIFDIDRLISMFTIIEDAYHPALGILSEGIYALEQYVIAKYHMTTQVYRHKTRLVTDSMIVRAIRLGVDQDKIDFLEKLYIYDGSEAFIENYLKWDDYRLINALVHIEGNYISKTIFQNLIQRILHKRIFTIEGVNLDPMVMHTLHENRKNDDFTKIVEENLSDLISREFNEEIRRELVILNVFSLKSIVEQANDDESEILIEKPFENPSSFINSSELFKYINESRSQQFVEVYAPVKYNDDDKRKRINSLHEKIKQSIVDSVNNYNNNRRIKI
ncbi:MAG: HD domain-containing protein [Bacteroidota bacterium]